MRPYIFLRSIPYTCAWLCSHLFLATHSACHRTAGAAGTGESRNGHQQMQQRDGQIAFW
jgi:hypothetical protein